LGQKVLSFSREGKKRQRVPKGGALPEKEREGKVPIFDPAGKEPGKE